MLWYPASVFNTSCSSLYRSIPKTPYGPGQAPQATSSYHTVTIAFYCHPLSSAAHPSGSSSLASILFRAMAEGRCRHCLSRAGHPGPWGQSRLEHFQLWQLPNVWAACSCDHPQRKQMFSELLGTGFYTCICPPPTGWVLWGCPFSFSLSEGLQPAAIPFRLTQHSRISPGGIGEARRNPVGCTG